MNNYHTNSQQRTMPQNHNQLYNNNYQYQNDWQSNRAVIDGPHPLPIMPNESSQREVNNHLSGDGVTYFTNNCQGGRISKGLIYKTVKVNGVPINGVIDTGSSATIVDKMIVDKIGKQINLNCNRHIDSVTGPIPIIGEVNLMIADADGVQGVMVYALVVENFAFDLLLGNDFNRLAGLVVDMERGTCELTKLKTKNEIVNLCTESTLECIRLISMDYHHMDVRQSKVIKVMIESDNINDFSWGKIIPSMELEEEYSIKIVDKIMRLDDGMGQIIIINQSERCNSLPIGICLGEIVPIPEFEKDLVFNIKEEKPEPSNEVKKVNLMDGEVTIGQGLDFNEQNDIIKLLNEYQDVFAFEKKKMGKCKIAEFSVELTDNRPIHISPYRYSAPARQEIQKQVAELLELGIISPSRSPYSFPVVLVTKPDGSARMCVDFRALNQIVKQDSYPLPSIEDILSYLQGSKYFATIDLNCGFWQIPVREKDREILSFCTQDSLYCFNYLPFGISTAPSFFQRVLDVVLSGLKYTDCFCYIDDIVVFGTNFESFILRLNRVLDRLREAGLTIKPSKCVFGVERVSYLGHIIDSSGIKMDPEKIRAVSQLQSPTNLTKLRRFLGCSGYYRRFIKNYSLIAQPLTKLLKKDEPFNWTETQKEAFEKIKQSLTKYPVLVHYDPNLPVELRCDASGYGLGSIILHNINASLHPISYASRLLNKAELNYSTTEKECLAVVWAVEKFKIFLDGRQFIVVTDHCSLCWLKTKKTLPSRLAKWALQLQPYDMTIVYKSGKLHKDVDCISRAPLAIDESNPEQPDLNEYLLHIDEVMEIPDIKTAQKHDKRWRDILRKIEENSELSENEKMKLKDFTVIENVLYKKVKNNNQIS